jgi:hypothetical protein
LVRFSKTRQSSPSNAWWAWNPSGSSGAALSVGVGSTLSASIATSYPCSTQNAAAAGVRKGCSKYVSVPQ